jgi:methyl coenzyme M reductase subunit D
VLNKIQRYIFYRSGLFKIIKAAITPGTQPQSHNKKTIKIDPQPFPMTAKGGQIIARSTLQKLIIMVLMIDDVTI